MAKDWRIELLETQRHLRGVSFARKPYKTYDEGWDHDHCAGCGTKLMEVGSQDPNALHEGFATTADYTHGEDYEWICVDCFATFAKDFGWIDATPPA